MPPRQRPRTDLTEGIVDGVYKAYERRLQADVLSAPVPRHVAIIMDGNRRFAESLGEEATAGHTHGKDKLEELLGWCLQLQIRVLTVFAFSTENLTRPKEELEVLMDLFEENFRRAGDDERVHRNRIRVRALGQIDLLPKAVQEAISYAEERTRGYDQYAFNLAVAYGGRQEIVHAIRRIAADAMQGTLQPADIDESVVSRYLYTSDLPDPDLILRTSGEERISNFLLWQLAYAELYFADVYWPGMRKLDFLRAIRSYQRRQRRFGT